jgi:L-alanine-DL-glutamate epimerase-like enolase superfamily enzyme
VKITRLDTVQLAQFPFLLWLLLHTDEGVVGTGETFFAPGPVAAYLHDDVAPYLLGTDPRDVERHSFRLQNVYVGSRDSGAETRGNSAIDIALWDICGQALGQPVWRLLGGRTHERVPVYNTCAGYGHARVSKRHALFERTEDWSLAAPAAAEGPYEDLLAFRFHADRLARSLRDEGIRAMKIWPFDVAAEASNGTRIGRAELARALDPFRKIRDAVGNDMDIMVELHGLWSLPCAMTIATALEPFAPAWIEEPIRFNEVSAMAQLARHTSIPICASERLATRTSFAAMIAAGAASIVMLDLAWCGGITEARKIAAMAEAHSLPVTLHDCTGPITFAASVALSTVLPNVNWQEMVRAYTTGWYKEVAMSLPVVANGHVTAPDAPGLGIALRPDLPLRADATVRTSTL